MDRSLSRIVACGLAALVLGGPASAGIVVYEEGEKKVEVGGRIQLLYELTDPDCPSGTGCIVDTGLGGTSSSFDELGFRRLRPYVAGTVNEHWFGKIEFDFGQAAGDDEVVVKDAYMRYSGLGRGLKLTIGNAKPFFSREFITSSARLQMVERSFVGDHDFGSPDRHLGLKLAGSAGSDRLGWGASAGMATHDPDSNRMDFDTPANDQADWNEGLLLTGRADYHPLGKVDFAQADFEGGDFRLVASLGAFDWRNDDDRNTYTDASGTTVAQGGPVIKADLDSATGLETSVALRGGGFSADVAYHRVSGETVDPGFTGGLYLDGETDLDIVAVTAGYMVVDDRLEVTAAWDRLDADGYAEPFERTTLGLNWYLDRHRLKVQANYRLVENFLGLPHQDSDVVLAMMQYVF